MYYSGHSMRHFVEQELGTLPHFVIYAILEWTLIGLLFLDGFLAFVSSEFAEFFDLQSPCVLCTRIDHILTRNKSRYCYNETICDVHKTDLSSLAYCHVHRKLSNIRTMCEGCLLSFAIDNNKSECSEAYKSYNRGLNKDLEGLFDDDLKARLQLQPLGKDDTGNGFENVIYCSCCGEPMKVKSTEYQKVNTNGNNNNNLGFPSNVPSRLSQQAPTSSPRAPFASWRMEESRTTLELSQIRCDELKLSETSNSNEEDMTNVVIPTESKEENKLTTPRPINSEDLMEDFGRTYSFTRGNRFFGISDSAVSSPRFANRMPRKSLLDKVELASDPVEAIIGNETDVEVILNRMKKQVRLDRKSLIALYMELDEERSASAVAANNAMAMITRLQAEKASIQMEALQYQRMMEEQAEYDKEDIQLLKDFLNKKEDELRGLEEELEYYRDRHGHPHVSRGDGLEKSQSFSSITEQESPLYSIVVANAHEHISNKSSCTRSSFEEGENNGLKNDNIDDHKEKVCGSLDEQEDDHTRLQNDDDLQDDACGPTIDIEHEGSFLLGQLKNLGVEDTPLFNN